MWQDGRQGGGYSKLTIWQSKRFKFDVYLLKLPLGSKVQWHTDPAPYGFEHHRINVELRSARRGGHTVFERSGKFQVAKRAYHFRPDKEQHFVSPVLDGSILMLSIGWLKNRDRYTLASLIPKFLLRFTKKQVRRTNA